MGNRVVKFIGCDYLLPEDLLTYIELLGITEQVKADIFLDFLRELSDSEVPCVDDNQLRGEIECQVGKFIEKLIENGIYDRTVNDYLRENEGYKLISKVNNAALEEAKRVLKQEMTEWLEGYEGALTKKDASITGLGFSIWSGSFINHVIYAAMEASKLREQGKVAAKEYQKDMEKLNAYIESKRNEDERQYIVNTYCPNMEVAITVFSYELLDTFISDLIKWGRFNEDILNYTNIDRSNDLLKNLNFSKNKDAVLRKAFEVCPYNLQVYLKALQYGRLQYDDFKTAQYFKQDKNILSVLVEELGEIEYPEKFEIDYNVAEKLAEFTERDVVSVLHAKTEDYVTALLHAYDEVVKLIANNELCRKMIVEECSFDTILVSNSLAGQEATRRVKSVVDSTVWRQLVDRCGYSNLLDQVKEYLPNYLEFATKEEVDDFLIAKLEESLEYARENLAPVIIKEKQTEEEKKKKQEAESIRLEREKQRKKRIRMVVCIAIFVFVFLALTLSEWIDFFRYIGVWHQRYSNAIINYRFIFLVK